MSPATPLEYGLIAAGIAVALIAIVNTLGSTLVGALRSNPTSVSQPVNSR